MESEHLHLLTASEVAARLGIAPSSFWRLRAKGEAPRGYWIGGSLRFQPAEVDAWIEAQAEDDA